MNFQITFTESDMNSTMTNKCDLKNLSLQLYGKEVEITLAENSASQKKYNTSSIKGILFGRKWGAKILMDGGKEDDVVSLLIRQGPKELEIPCKDISLLK
jgi:hypothetical protein